MSLYRNPSPLLKTNIEAALAAGRILLKFFGKKLEIREKKGAGLVTKVDLAAESAALKVLRRHSKSFAFLTEETFPALDTAQKNGNCWILDPLDGTTNFIHGFPMFCVSIGAQVDGQLQTGVIYHPVLNELYVAEKGKGAELWGKKREKLCVSNTRRVYDSLLTTGFTYRKDEWLQCEMNAFEQLSRVSRAVRRPGSAALDLAYTSRGVFDGFWERRLSPWDVAAGALLVREAGGVVTDCSGGTFRFEKQEIVASNPYLHKALIKELIGCGSP